MFFFLSCVCYCYAFVRVCLYVPSGHLLGKGWPLGSCLWCPTVSLSLSHWYPGFSLNVFIANIKQGVGPQVFPKLVTALPLKYTYKALHRQWRTYFFRNKVMIIVFLKWAKWYNVIDGSGNENEWLDGLCWSSISVFQSSGAKRFILLNFIWGEV